MLVLIFFKLLTTLDFPWCWYGMGMDNETKICWFLDKFLHDKHLISSPAIP